MMKRIIYIVFTFVFLASALPAEEGKIGKYVISSGILKQSGSNAEILGSLGQPYSTKRIETEGNFLFPGYWRFIFTGELLSIPDAPTLIYPPDNFTNIYFLAKFRWYASGDAEKYELMVSEDSEFSTSVISDTGISDTIYKMQNIEENTTYYWKVRANKNDIWGNWSATWKFTTKPVPTYTDPYPEWENYTNGDEVTCIAEEGPYLWIGTTGGLVKMNKETEEKTFFNRGNSYLPDNRITCIAVDNEGVKWIGTFEDGIVQFDGTNWIVYNESNSLLPNNDIWDIFVCNNEIWIATFGGVAKIENNTWTVFNKNNSGISSNFIRCITVDSEEKIWIGTNNGISIFDRTNWVNLNYQNSSLPDSYIECITIDKSNTKWIGTYDYGLVIYDDSNWINYYPKNSDLSDSHINDITIDTSGVKWIGTGNGISKYDDNQWTILTTENSELPNKSVGKIFIDNANIVWIGTAACFIQLDDSNWNIYNISNSALLGRTVCSIAIGGDNNKWVGTNSIGLVKYYDTDWNVYDTSNSDFPWDNSNFIAIDCNNVKWIGTSYSGLVKFDDTDWNVYDTSNSDLPWNNINSIAIDCNNVKWIGTSYGLAEFDEIDWTVFNPSNSDLPDKDVRTIAIDDNNIKWIGTDEGVARFDEFSWTIYNESNSVLPDNWINAIALDINKNRWIGTNYGGLAKFDGTEWTVYDTLNSGLPDNKVKSIAIDNNNVKWIGTGNGIAKYDEADWTIYNTSNSGIPDNTVQSIAIDSLGNIWIGTDWYGGLAKYTPTSSYSISMSSIEQTEFCQGDEIEIELNINKDFNEGNTFYVELSDENGSFDSPTVIGSVKAQTIANIVVSIPYDVPEGNKYRIRITASSPAVQADDNGTDITIRPSPKAEISGPEIACVTENSIFTASTDNAGSTKWEVVNGQIVGADDQSTVEIKWDSKNSIGTVTLSQADNEGICSTTNEHYVHIIPVFGGNGLACVNETETYSTFSNDAKTNFWQVEGGTLQSSETADKIEVLWDQEGEGKVILTQTVDSTSCSDTDTIKVIVSPQPDTPVITGSQDVCSGIEEIYSVENISGYIYLWSVEGGTMISEETKNETVIKWDDVSDGSLKIIIRAGQNCMDSTEIAVNISTSPSIALEGDTIVCMKNTYTYSTVLEADVNYNWEIEGGDITGSSDGNETTVIWDTPQHSKLSLTATSTLNDCEATVEREILVTPYVNGNMNVCSGIEENYQTYEDDGLNNQWIITGGTTNDDLSGHSIDVTWGGPGTATLWLIQEITSSGCIDTAKYDVIISDCNPQMVIAIDSFKAEEGAIIDIPVYLKDIQAIEITKSTAISADITFSSLLLEPTGQTVDISSTQDQDDLTLHLDSYPLDKESEEQVLETLHLLVKYNEIKETGLTISNALCDSNDISIDLQHGYFKLILDSTIIKTGEFIAKPGDIIYIPVTIENPELALEAGASRINTNMMYNSNILSAQNAEAEISGDTARLPLVFVLTESGEEISLQVPFKVRLADHECTDLIFTDITTDNDFTVTSEAGELCVEICKEGGERLVTGNSKLYLRQNSPNPSTDKTTIIFSVIEKGYYELELYDIFGRKVSLLFNGSLEPGVYQKIINTNEFPNGTYFYILQTPSVRLNKRMEIVH